MKPSDDLIVSSVEPTGLNRKKVWMQKGKNQFNKNKKLLNAWINDQGNITVYENKNVVSELIPCKPNTTYTVSGYPSSVFVKVVSYNKNREYINVIIDIQSSETKQTFTTGNNDCYIRIGYGDSADTIDSLQLEQNSTVTEYEEYIEPKIYVKNDNNVYEELIQKEEKSVIDVYRNDYTTTSTEWEKVNFAGITNKVGTAFEVQNGEILCNKTMTISIEGRYYWTGISNKRVGYQIRKNDSAITNATYNKYCPNGGYYDIPFDKTTVKVSAGDKLSLYLRTEEGSGGASGSRGNFIVQEL